jgi:hypothetical protein
MDFSIPGFEAGRMQCGSFPVLSTSPMSGKSRDLGSVGQCDNSGEFVALKTVGRLGKRVSGTECVSCFSVSFIRNISQCNKC